MIPIRVNVYAEEITTEVTTVEKVAEDTGRKFYGVRMFLDSPDTLHNQPDDDDRSAITFFVPWTQKEGYDTDVLRTVFDRLGNRLRSIEEWLKTDNQKLNGVLPDK